MMDQRMAEVQQRVSSHKGPMLGVLELGSGSRDSTNGSQSGNEQGAPLGNRSITSFCDFSRCEAHAAPEQLLADKEVPG